MLREWFVLVLVVLLWFFSSDVIVGVWPFLLFVGGFFLGFLTRELLLSEE